jgi:gamma-glutamylputrescine oxidase
MHSEVFWTRGRRSEPWPKLAGPHSASVAIIGGGIAGLTVADELSRRGVKEIVLLEARTCGAGASGRSSGFITPPSELGLFELRRRFGDADARILWDAAQGGCDAIAERIDRWQIECGHLSADSFYVASDGRGAGPVQAEHDARRDLGYESRLYDESAVTSAIGGRGFGRGVRFGRTFAINSFDYVRGLSARLADLGVRIFEDSTVTSVTGEEVRTREGLVRAGTVFFCLDHAASEVRTAKRDVYHAQTFLAVSEPLDETLHRSVFPDGPLMVWDTDLIYQYFRPTADRRLLVGGGLLSRTYAPERRADAAPVEHLLRYVRSRFPQLSQLRFEATWPGLIGVTKDLLPLAGKIEGTSRHYAALCSAGLPWSSLAARVAVEVALDGESALAGFLRPRRSFTEIELFQPLLRTPLTFALSHAYAKSLLKGNEREVARRKRAMGWTMIGGLVAAAVALLWKRWQ